MKISISKQFTLDFLVFKSMRVQVGKISSFES